MYDVPVSFVTANLTLPAGQQERQKCNVVRTPDRHMYIPGRLERDTWRRKRKYLKRMSTVFRISYRHVVFLEMIDDTDTIVVVGMLRYGIQLYYFVLSTCMQ